MELTQSLKNLGLNEKEAKVYIALLQTGKATAYTVAKHSDLKKPTVYVVLDNLIDKGFAVKIPRVKTMHYSAIDPEDLFSIVESKVQNAREALPELKALSRGKIHKVKVSYYEGLDGVKEAYKKMLKTMKGKEIVGFYGHGKNAPQNLIEYWDEFNNERIKKKIKMRGINPTDKTTKKYIQNQTKLLLNLKNIPLNKYDSDISIDIFKNFTQIISFRNLQAIVIENPDVAKAMRQIFEMVWERES